MLFVTVIFIPETPSFLVLNGRDDDAYRSLQWLRGTNKNVEVELETIRNNIRASKFNMSMANNRNGDADVSLSMTNRNFPVRESFKSIVTNVKSVLGNARLVRPLMVRI